jgi:hypothetical protein
MVESSETYFDPSDTDEIDRSALAGEVVEVCKTYGDPAATDDQAPDAPARPKTEENDAPNGGHQHLPPEAIRGRIDSKNKTKTSEEQRAEAVLKVVPDSSMQKFPPMIKPDILVANDDSAGNTGAQSTGNSYYAVIKKADETTEETFVEEEPQESPTLSLVTNPAISVAYENSVNCSVQSVGIFCDAVINGDIIGVQSTSNYAATESKEQGAEEELQKDSPVTKFVIIVANVNCNSLTGVQSAGKLLNADIIGLHRRRFYNADADKHGGRPAPLGAVERREVERRQAG